MWYLVVKGIVSGVIATVVSEVAKRYPGWGALIASLPLISILGMMWLWRDTHDRARLAAHAEATFWFVIPSMPMFLLVPAMLRRGVGFWPSLVVDHAWLCGDHLDSAEAGTPALTRSGIHAARSTPEAVSCGGRPQTIFNVRPCTLLLEAS